MVDYNNKFLDILIGLPKNVIEFHIGLDWIDKLNITICLMWTKDVETIFLTCMGTKDIYLSIWSWHQNKHHIILELFYNKKTQVGLFHGWKCFWHFQENFLRNKYYITLMKSNQ
jgi:hypothetical protein